MIQSANSMYCWQGLSKFIHIALFPFFVFLVLWKSQSILKISICYFNLDLGFIIIVAFLFPFILVYFCFFSFVLWIVSYFVLFMFSFVFVCSFVCLFVLFYFFIFYFLVGVYYFLFQQSIKSTGKKIIFLIKFSVF